MKNNAETDQEEEKKLIVSLGEKKLFTGGCTGRNGEREKSSGQKNISNDSIKIGLWGLEAKERVKWTDKIRNEAVLKRLGEERMMLKLIRKGNWLGHWLRRNCLLKDALDEMVKNGEEFGAEEDIGTALGKKGKGNGKETPLPMFFSLTLLLKQTQQGTASVVDVKRPARAGSYDVCFIQSSLSKACLPQDNHPIHTANRIQRWFARRCDVDPVDWPPKSPDMNPIQNLWAAVKRILRSNWAEQPPVRTLEELWERVLDAWVEVTKNLDLFHNLVDSIPRRMRAVVDAGGLWTRY
ncbi:hypothetical protein ANN_01429 [Periplaneta americana]|uniref:Tc1-like transposase DDE domain-containing protein n=1 Tax=Periplaneta americana TaxID=6978 RepID=A0ABQ8TVB2_PERAM|nr:hypothetical protein ANN_01429 [Periplaneta americana]